MENSVSNVSIALWIITGFVVLGCVALSVALYFIVKIMKGLMDSVKEMKSSITNFLSDIRPLVNTADSTLKDLQSTSAKIRETTEKVKDISEKLSGITSSITSFVTAFSAFGGLFPFAKKGGLLSGIMSGINLVSSLKNMKPKKGEKKNNKEKK